MSAEIQISKFKSSGIPKRYLNSKFEELGSIGVEWKNTVFADEFIQNLKNGKTIFVSGNLKNLSLMYYCLAKSFVMQDFSVTLASTAELTMGMAEQGSSFLDSYYDADILGLYDFYANEPFPYSDQYKKWMERLFLQRAKNQKSHLLICQDDPGNVYRWWNHFVVTQLMFNEVRISV